MIKYDWPRVFIYFLGELSTSYLTSCFISIPFLACVLFIADSSRNSIGCHILIATTEELIASIV